MLKHIIFFKSIQKNENLRQSEIAELKEKLEAMLPEMDFILTFEVGLNAVIKPISYDLCLYCEFESEVDLELYRVHPAHQKVVEFIHSKLFERAVVDYFI